MFDINVPDPGSDDWSLESGAISLPQWRELAHRGAECAEGPRCQSSGLDPRPYRFRNEGFAILVTVAMEFGLRRSVLPFVRKVMRTIRRDR